MSSTDLKSVKSSAVGDVEIVEFQLLDNAGDLWLYGQLEHGEDGSLDINRPVGLLLAHFHVVHSSISISGIKPQ